MEKMKRLTALLCLLLALMPTLLHAQVVDVCAGDGTDSVTLSVDNYQYGNIQWQISEDTLTWTDIPGANDTVYRFKPEGNETRYYRAWMQYPNCPDESSAVTRVQFLPNANAGPDRILNEDFVTTLFGNRVEDEGVRCMWQVIEGDSANLEDPTYCNSRFSGPDTLYKLTWTVANACGVSVDTVEIRYVHTVMYDAIAIVDTTDIILSDSAEMASGFYRIVFSNPVPNITDSTILMGMDGDDFLRRVIDFEWFGDTCEIYASPADFLDILVEGAINFEIPLNFNDTNQRRGLRHIYTRAELMNDPRFVSGQWNNLFQEWFRDSYESGTRGPRSIIGSDYVELSSHFQIRDFNPYFSENTLYGADHYKDNNGTLHAFVCLIGDWHTDFTLRLKDGSASVTIDVPTSASVDIPNPFRPNKTIASLGLYIPIVFTGSVQSQNWVDIPVRVTTPISVMGSYHGNPKKFWRIMRDLDYRNESELPTIEATEPDLNGNSFECTLEFKVGAKLGLSFLEDKVGLWFNVLPTLSYSICLGSNGFKSQTVSSYVKATVTGELWFVGVDFDDIWSATWGYSSWHTPYKVTTTTNRNLDIPTDGSYISEPVQVQVFNQDNRPVKSGKKVLFESTDGVVSSIPSGDGSASAFATTDINGIAQIYWKPNNVQNSVLKASVLDCNGNHINGSPLFFYTDCYHSTLSLRIVDDRLSASGGDGAYSFLFFQYSADNINWTYSPNELYPLVPGTTYFVKDNNGCKAATTYTVQESTPDCNLGLGAQQDGLDVVIMVNNGIPPFHYYVDGVDQTPDGYDGRRKRFTFTEGGEHNFSVTDDDGFGCNSGTFSVRLSDGITVPIVSTSTTYNRVHNVYDQVMGAVTDNGGAPILERGVQWSLSSDMSNATNVTSSFTGDGLGRFVCNISGVSAGTTYYARAYATNSEGPGYGAVIPITVPGSAPTGNTNSCGVSSIRSNETGSNGTITAVRDHQNNSYAVVQIGSQCWLKENMRCTTSPTTGANIVQNPASGSSSTVRRAYYYDNNPSNAANGCGLLYNWFAAVDGLDVESSRGICPEGWHVPTDAEWTTMMNAAVSIYQPGTTPNPEFGSLNMNSEFEGINTLISQLLSDSSRAKWTNLLAMIELYYQEGYMTADTYNGYMNYFLNPNFLGNATGFSAFPAGLYSSSNFSQDRGASFWSSSQSSSQYGSRVWTREFYYIMPGVQRWAQDKGIAMSVRCLRNSDGYVMPTGDGYPCQNAPTVTDIDNNTYFTVQIGNQCWMKENLRTTRYSDGTNIPEGNTNSYSQPYRYLPNDDGDNVETFGYLYNWSAVMHGATSSSSIPSGVQGVCPIGWHVPSKAEWTQLINYVGNQSQYVCGSTNTNIAKALASTEWWNYYSYSQDDCLVGHIQADNNTTGFSVFPAGYYSEGVEYVDFGKRAVFWSSTGVTTNTARSYHLCYNTTDVSYFSRNKDDAYSVRCLRDSDNGDTPNPPSPSTTSCGVSSIRSNETGSNGTITAVRDHQNNSYAVVQIGNQCWLKENMRATEYSDGTNIPEGSTSSITDPYRYVPNNDVSSVDNYGYLYNWAAVMHGAASSSANPSDVQGICPVGWHVPSDAEWMQLITYVGGQPEFICGNNSSNVAKALSATFGWNSHSGDCSVGNNISSNDATGFSAFPAGGRNSAIFGEETGFWCATQSLDGFAYYYDLKYSDACVFRYGSIGGGYSVRCLRDADNGDTPNPPSPSNTTSCGVSSIRSNETGSNGTITAVQDHENNSYSVVQIGSQCWLKENMRCTTSPSSGANMVQNPANGYSNTVLRAYYYDNNSANAANGYGLLYNWPAAMDGSTTAGARGICPEGWHLPTDTEWTTMTDYVSGQSQFWCGGVGTYIAKALATTMGWNSSANICAVGNDPSDNNSTGFSVLPAGAYNFGNYYGTGNYAYFWSSVENEDAAYCRRLDYLYNFVSSFSFDKSGGYSVRCLRDAESGYTPTSNIQPCPGISTVTDYEGNVYNTVKIGEQCWMRENMRTTHYADGTAIPGGGSNTSITAPYYYDYSSSDISLAQRGYLYNWPAAMHSAASSGTNPSGVQGICPTGWHLPSNAEWTQLTDYVSGQSQYTCGGDNTFIAIALASTKGWISSGNTCTCGIDQAANNATGFSAVPAGNCYGSSFHNMGTSTFFWSATEYISDLVFIRELDCFNASVRMHNNLSKSNGYSVRCLRDGGETKVLPTVSTSVVENVTTTTATCGGNVTSDGGANVTARGVCWSSNQNPTISDNHTTDGSGVGGFTSNISGLTAGVTYYVRAYATNCVGTAYGNEVFVTVPGSTGNNTSCSVSSVHANETGFNGTITAVRDHENNSYSVVQIGGQCWLKENMRCTTSPTTGANIVENPASSSNWSYYERRAYYINNNPDSADNGCGLLYNWRAAMDGSTFEGDQGICPEGWHVPRHDDWTQLTDYVSSVVAYRCGDDDVNIAKALASSSGWNISTNECAIGNNQSTNDISGFSALPVGVWGSNFAYSGNDARFWSSSPIEYNQDNSRAVTFDLSYDRSYCFHSDWPKFWGLSVRCVRDSSNGEDPSPSSTTSCNVNTIYNNETGNNGTITAVQDHENNSYAVVQIGGQCWLKENMRCTTSPSTGANMVASGLSNIERRVYYYNNNPANAVNGYGLFYNWPAAMDGDTTAGARGICPEGWHVPTDSDWTKLGGYVGENYACIGLYNAKALASVTGWNSSVGECYPGDQTTYENNVSGFGALPVGFATYYNSGGAGYNTSLWSSSKNEDDTDNAYARGLEYNNPIMYSINASKDFGYSVRCLRDSCPSCVDTTVVPVDTTVVPVDTTVMPIDTTVIPIDTNTTYGIPCPDSPTVTDHQGNVYNTVQIGSRCWMKENMRCTTSPTTGANIVQNPAVGASYTERRAYYYNNDPTNAANGYGLLYNWPAAMDGGTVEGARGICPEGWHIPTDVEWTVLMSTAVNIYQPGVTPSPAFGTGGSNGINQEGVNTDIALALTSLDQIQGINDTLELYYQNGLITASEYNESLDFLDSILNSPAGDFTGFSALCTGAYICYDGDQVGNFSERISTVVFWSSSQNDNFQAWWRVWGWDQGVYRMKGDKGHGVAVRCLRD